MENIPDIVFTNDADEEVTLSCVYIVCPYCQGKGRMVNPAIDGHGITAEEFDEDPSFREEYMSGIYDIYCPECKGRRVVPEPCKWTNDKADLKDYEKYLQDEADYQATVDMERRMGC